jgi:flagellar basal-body rod modification protein FlgD
MSGTTVTNTSNTGTSSASASSSTNPLGSLSSNYTNFLNLLMTQLKNQDPASPMDPNAFTTELVQFSGVEQQINTNTNLTSLIQIAQGSQVLQSSSIVGKTVDVTSSKLSLQNGAAAISFAPPAAGPVTIDVLDSSGNAIRQDTVNATAGVNAWTWDGTDATGTTRPDGAYTVVITGSGGGAGTAAIPFSVIGTVTGIQKSGTALQLELGKLPVDFSAIQSVGS